MPIVEESGIRFGDFDETKFFNIEKSEIYKSIGTGVKTVEFIVLNDRNDILMVEAKTGCPNPNTHSEGRSKEDFDKFYKDISDKFIDSLQIFISGVMKSYDSKKEIGNDLLNTIPLCNFKIKFVLVVTSDEIDTDWLECPKLELENYLKKYMKIWRADVVVLNKALAKEFGIVA